MAKRALAKVARKSETAEPVATAKSIISRLERSQSAQAADRQRTYELLQQKIDADTETDGDNGPVPEETGDSDSALAAPGAESPAPSEETEFTVRGGAHPDDVLRARREAIFIDRSVTEEDLDLLWDWVRADPDKGLRFLGIAPKTYKEMLLRVQRYGVHLLSLREQSLTSDVVTLLGFVGLTNAEQPRIGAHLYLAPATRGRAREVVPRLLELAGIEYPGASFNVITPDPALARLYRGLGMEEYFLYVYTPKTAAEVVE